MNIPTGDEGQEERRCLAVTEEGRPCEAISEFVGASGFCFSHDPEKAQERKAAQQRGGIATARKLGKALDPDELGPLNTPEDAQRWAAVVALAVATGRVSANQAQALRALLAEWRASHAAGETRQRIEDLVQIVEELVGPGRVRR